MECQSKGETPPHKQNMLAALIGGTAMPKGEDPFVVTKERRSKSHTARFFPARVLLHEKSKFKIYSAQCFYDKAGQLSVELLYTGTICKKKKAAGRNFSWEGICMTWCSIVKISASQNFPLYSMSEVLVNSYL